MEWQPIATAPKDRTRVLLYSPEGQRPAGRPIFEGYFGFNGVCKAWFKSESHHSVEPTHWMPLPPAPPG